MHLSAIHEAKARSRSMPASRSRDGDRSGGPKGSQGLGFGVHGVLHIYPKP